MNRLQFNKADINESTFLSTISTSESPKIKEDIIKYFRAYTGKKHILITDSARTCLYLAHRFLDFNSNEVFVSPLTCKSALTPIIAAGKKINFIDIDEETLFV